VHAAEIGLRVGRVVGATDDLEPGKNAEERDQHLIVHLLIGDLSVVGDVEDHAFAGVTAEFHVEFDILDRFDLGHECLAGAEVFTGVAGKNLSLGYNVGQDVSGFAHAFGFEISNLRFEMAA
jgi:hypothetical protein